MGELRARGVGSLIRGRHLVVVPVDTESMEMQTLALPWSVGQRDDRIAAWPWWSSSSPIVC